MKSEDWENANLVQTAVKLAKMKRIRKKQTTIQMSLLVPVLGIIGYDVYTAGICSSIGISRFFSLGWVAGWRSHRSQNPRQDAAHQ